MPVEVRQLQDRGTGESFVPVTHWDAVSNKPDVALKSDLPTVETVANTVLSKELSPNTIYIFTNRTNDLTITLGTPAQDQIAIYHLIIEVGDTLPTLTFPVSVEWPAGFPVFSTTDRLEINILDNNALYIV